MADADDSAPDDPCIPNKAAPTCDQDKDGIPNASDNDDDGDGTPDADDPAPNDPCRPNMDAPTCDQDGDGLVNKDDPDPTDPDHDGDGYLDGEDPDPNDPCVPNVNAPTCDKDGDGIPNGDDPNPGHPDEDSDGDGVVDASDPDPNDPCVPDVNASTCDQDGDGLVNKDDPNPTDPDSDGDGYKDGSDPDPNDPCVPNVNAPTCDQDGDGLINKDDPDPTNSDSDGDGYKDSDDTDPNDPCKPDKNAPTCDQDGDGLINKDDPDPTNPDSDGDGLSDGEELELGTDPKKADTDGDGLNDYDETKKYHTDPLKADTDDDGLKDGEEVNKYHTDPLDADTDDDGLSDGEEISLGTDPLKADTDGDGVKDGDDTADGKSAATNPCLPKQDPGYTDYDNKNEIWIADDCDGDGYSNGAEDNVSLGDEHYMSDPYDKLSACFFFDNLKYCEVHSKDDRIWLDRNLGATEVCNSASDSECYGYLYQWGRSSDGHQKRDSGNQDRNPNVWPYMSVNFETAYKDDHDWLSEAADNEKSAHVKERQDYWMSKSNVELEPICPDGWYVPSKDEIDAMVAAEGISNATNAYASALKLPRNGRKTEGGGQPSLEGDTGFLWSTDILAANIDGKSVSVSSAFIYDDSGTSWSSAYRANGYAVRCIKTKK